MPFFSLPRLANSAQGYLLRRVTLPDALTRYERAKDDSDATIHLYFDNSNDTLEISRAVYAAVIVRLLLRRALLEKGAVAVLAEIDANQLALVKAALKHDIRSYAKIHALRKCYINGTSYLSRVLPAEKIDSVTQEMDAICDGRPSADEIVKLLSNPSSPMNNILAVPATPPLETPPAAPDAVSIPEALHDDGNLSTQLSLAFYLNDSDQLLKLINQQTVADQMLCYLQLVTWCIERPEDLQRCQNHLSQWLTEATWLLVCHAPELQALNNNEWEDLANTRNTLYEKIKKLGLDDAGDTWRTTLRFQMNKFECAFAAIHGLKSSGITLAIATAIAVNRKELLSLQSNIEGQMPGELVSTNPFKRFFYKILPRWLCLRLPFEAKYAADLPRCLKISPPGLHYEINPPESGITPEGAALNQLMAARKTQRVDETVRQVQVLIDTLLNRALAAVRLDVREHYLQLAEWLRHHARHHWGCPKERLCKSVFMALLEQKIGERPTVIPQRNTLTDAIKTLCSPTGPDYVKERLFENKSSQSPKSCAGKLLSWFRPRPSDEIVRNAVAQWSRTTPSPHQR